MDSKPPKFSAEEVKKFNKDESSFSKNIMNSYHFEEKVKPHNLKDVTEMFILQEAERVMNYKKIGNYFEKRARAMVEDEQIHELLLYISNLYLETFFIEQKIASMSHYENKKINIPKSQKFDEGEEWKRLQYSEPEYHQKVIPSRAPKTQEDGQEIFRLEKRLKKLFLEMKEYKTILEKRNPDEYRMFEEFKKEVGENVLKN